MAGTHYSAGGTAYDMAALGQYVKAQDSAHYERVAEGTVSLLVTHSNLQQRWPDIRFDLHMSIQSVKDKLHFHGGTNSAMMRLILKDFSGNVIGEMNDDSKPLGFYSAQSGMCIHIIDIDPYSLSKDGGLENVNLVKKYVMSDEDYNKRKGTLREYKRKKREQDPGWCFFDYNRKDNDEKAPPPGPESVAGWKVGDRCEITPGGRRGEVMFIGEVGVLPDGQWVGVKFDEPVGKHNGTVKGKKLFECGDKYGAVVRPHLVKVGDYPERGLSDLEDSDEEL